MSIHHTTGSNCPLCALKLVQAHPDLRAWFTRVKAKFPSIHISWSYRDEESQEQAFKDGKSHLHYPQSAHNKTPALALDLFELSEGGNAVWLRSTLKCISDEFGAGIRWGGTWVHLGDFDHFEIVV